MLCEVLNIKDEKRLTALINEDYFSAEINALLLGYYPCWIFTDNTSDISTALIYSKSLQGFYLVGDESNDEFINLLPVTLNEVIIPRLKKKHVDCFEFSCSHQGWISVFARIFKNIEIGISLQNIYSFCQREKGDEDVELSDTFGVFKIDHDLLAKKINNIDFLYSKINLFWNSVELFLDNGIGFCLVDSNEIVSICISGFVYNDKHCVDIETLPHQRNKGYASMLVKRYLKELNTRNLIPSWECMDKNIISKHLAEKHGFCLKEQYKLYCFNI